MWARVACKFWHWALVVLPLLFWRYHITPNKKVKGRRNKFYHSKINAIRHVHLLSRTLWGLLLLDKCSTGLSKSVSMSCSIACSSNFSPGPWYEAEDGGTACEHKRRSLSQACNYYLQHISAPNVCEHASVKRASPVIWALLAAHVSRNAQASRCQADALQSSWWVKKNITGASNGAWLIAHDKEIGWGYSRNSNRSSLWCELYVAMKINPSIVDDNMQKSL